MGVTMIRVLVLAAAAAFVLAPATASACPAHKAHTAQADTTDLAAKTKAAPVKTDAKSDASKTAPAK